MYCTKEKAIHKVIERRIANLTWNKSNFNISLILSGLWTGFGTCHFFSALYLEVFSISERINFKTSNIAVIASLSLIKLKSYSFKNSSIFSFRKLLSFSFRFSPTRVKISLKCRRYSISSALSSCFSSDRYFIK